MYPLTLLKSPSNIVPNYHPPPHPPSPNKKDLLKMFIGNYSQTMLLSIILFLFYLIIYFILVCGMKETEEYKIVVFFFFSDLIFDAVILNLYLIFFI